MAVTAAVFRGQKGRLAGESHPRVKHSDDEVRRVRDMHDTGMGWRRIARALGLPATWVKDIVDFSRRPFVPVRTWPAEGEGAAEQLR